MFPKNPEGKGKQLSNAQVNIKKFRGFVGMSQAEVDEAIGAGKGETYDIERGKRTPDRDYKREFAGLMGIKDPAILDMKLELPALLNAFLGGGDSAAPEPPPLRVPYWGIVPCGNWERPTSDPTKIEISGRLSMIPLKDLIAVRTSGDSLKPLYMPNQIVPIRLSNRRIDGMVSLLINQDQELSLKVARSMSNGWEFHSINPMAGRVWGEEVTVLGHAVEVPGTFEPEGVRI